MPSHADTQLPSDLSDIAARLAQERPEADAHTLERMRMRARSRAAAGPRRTPALRSRFALVGVVTAGILMSGTGTSLAITGLLSTPSASVAQYGPGAGSGTGPGSTGPGTLGGGGGGGGGGTTGVGPSSTRAGTSGAPAVTSGGPATTPGTEATRSGGGNTGVQSSGGSSGQTGVQSSGQNGAAPTTVLSLQPTRQLAVGGGRELPFTGFIVFPLLIGGLVLLGGGLVLRRRTRPVD